MASHLYLALYVKKRESNTAKYCDLKIFFLFAREERFFYSSNLLIEFSEVLTICANSRGIAKLQYFLLPLSLSFIVSNPVSSSFLSNKTLSSGHYGLAVS